MSTWKEFFYRTDSGLDEVPSDIPPEATEVYLQDNKITELKTGTFSHLMQCTKLYIYSNSITTIEGDAFSGMETTWLFISVLQQSYIFGKGHVQWT